MTVVAALFIGGIIIVLFEVFHKDKEGSFEDLATLPYRTAFFIGAFQAVSVIPGVSRAAATILGGLWLGMKRTAIVEFSFLLAVPTMAAATGLDLLKHASLFSTADFHLLLVGFVVSFLVALVAIKFLIRFVKTHTFTSFGIYRMVVALLFFFFVLSV